MINFDLGPLHVTMCFARDAGWIMVNRLVVHAKRSKPLFTERHGYERFVKIPFCNWRFRIDIKRIVDLSKPISGLRHERILTLVYDQDEDHDPISNLDEEFH